VDRLVVAGAMDLASVLSFEPRNAMWRKRDVPRRKGKQEEEAAIEEAEIILEWERFECL